MALICVKDKQVVLNRWCVSITNLSLIISKKKKYLLFHFENIDFCLEYIYLTPFTLNGQTCKLLNSLVSFVNLFSTLY